ncbi:type II toxin-antitoxin system RelE/ParE family toxin [Roseisolibacter sp. H3M3-2]|uniref:type II toxin-antitoxin system RelE/ParE family toxin n=1 Tax=Roseisolibacter sp. H3M3-2 TaxID=3031323 RepID=UPI0023DB9D52|nr:type II toxin-antitoxin system RelE/ParE family toxin [Roseisolibacter sp. H3M3-2]MDF1501794.1 type II toxin-antitoxin system RelE/ParE family toxin [Roseisolibacter sp. H3M3-2]
MTAPRFSFRAAAAADLAAAYEWYEGRESGLGEALLRAVGEAAAGAAAAPEQYPVVRGDVRRVLVGRFPYGLFYRVLRGEVVVVACFHLRRDPQVWHRRR